ncbi:hypothetical protein ACH5RR_023952 [Cinchona calisaya]|uniref:Uncharacterized protein n=1 Tax=Cinchona calisaya TaxID=153742 RepID=A0ABD2ZFJ5_9GENT
MANMAQQFRYSSLADHFHYSSPSPHNRLHHNTLFRSRSTTIPRPPFPLQLYYYYSSFFVEPKFQLAFAGGNCDDGINGNGVGVVVVTITPFPHPHSSRALTVPSDPLEIF